MQRNAGENRFAAITRKQIAAVVRHLRVLTGTTSTLRPLTANLMQTEWSFGLI